MGRRRKAREATIQILFQLEFNEGTLEEILNQYWKSKKAEKEVREYSSWLVKNILKHKDDLDRIIQSKSEHWRLSRMAVIDRNILRMAVFELIHKENLAPAIVINEAIEVAKKYSSVQSANFINGILDAVNKAYEREKNLPKGGTNG
ncbi:MAG: transcription antitermination factor NusB [Candidatus Aminicenantes bacterium]|jgi:N utilization substance protein B